MKSLRRFSLPTSLLAFALGTISSPLQAALLYNLTFEDGDTVNWANGGTVGGKATAVESGFAIAPAPSRDRTKAYSGSWSGSFFPASVGNPSYAGNTVLPDSTARFRMDSTDARMTIGAWVNWAGQAEGNNRHGIVNTLNSSQTAGWTLYIEADGKLAVHFVQASSGRGRSRVTTEPVVPLGKWTHVAVTWDASAGAKSPIKIYVDGEPRPTTGASLTDAVAVAGEDATLGPLDIALGSVSHSPGAGGSFSLNGHLDDFAIWNTALDEPEVRALVTASALFPSCTASVMNQLFEAYHAKKESRLGNLVWSHATGLPVTGRTVGDMWQAPDGRLYLWLGGDGAKASGLVGVKTGS